MADSEVKVSDLDNVGSISANDLILLSKLVGSGYSSRSGSMADLASAILDTFEYPELSTSAKTILDAINELTPQPLTKADFFDVSTNVGDFYAWHIGKMVVINRMSFNSVTFDGSVVNGVLIKAKYRPSATIRTITDVGGGSLFARCNIRNTGEMAISYGTSTASNNSYMFVTTYITA